ncbi:hypothetical protein [Nostoc sp. 106C]|uniref:hypothetical protein n=1 Tax=Nostoc sp. 106C TaxID=1932667 RepID=UPI000A3CA22A|nr:hypothetical protein [Nostoc sp. 106C]OUL33457.1 hypothetical protein BV375_07225 [Nostoc sp. 106C]
MLLKNILLGTALAGVTLAAQPNVVQAQICPQNSVVPAAIKPRIIRQERLGYRFNIPDNYRTLVVRENGILVLDPNSFTRAQCLIKNKAPTEYPKSISIYITSVNSKNRTLTEIVKQNDSTAEKFANTKVANQAAISYISNTLGVEKKVAFFSRDRKYIITVSTLFNFNQGRPTTIFNQAVFDRVLSSFTFVN